MLTKHLIIQLSYTPNHIISSADFYNIIFIKLIAHYINIMSISSGQIFYNIILFINAASCNKCSHVIYMKKYNITDDVAHQHPDEIVR